MAQNFRLCSRLASLCLKQVEYHRISIQAKWHSKKVEKLPCRSKTVSEVSRIYCHSPPKASCHRLTSQTSPSETCVVSSPRSSPACAFPGPQRHLRRWEISLGKASCRGAQQAQARGPRCCGAGDGCVAVLGRSEVAGALPGPPPLSGTSPDPGGGVWS